MPTAHGDITALLQQARDGHAGALDALFPLVYDELRQIARMRLSKHRPGDTLNTTALVHEAYLKLVDQTSAAPNDRQHFFALASRAMRFILVDYARSRTADKRGGRDANLPLSDVQVGIESNALELLALNQETADILPIALDERWFKPATLPRVLEYEGFTGPQLAARIHARVPVAQTP